MQINEINIEKNKIINFCKRHHIRKLSLFGSILREDYSKDSDIDVLVEFESGFVPGLEFFNMEEELSEIMNHKVDLNTQNFINAKFRNTVIAESEVLYVSR